MIARLFQKYFGRVVAEQGRYKFRVVKIWRGADKGYEPQMLTNSGMRGDFWTPLSRTGYWAEPDSFSYATVKARHALPTFEEALAAIQRAVAINEAPANRVSPLQEVTQ